MNLFGIGPLEFLLILLIAIIVLGPKGMVQAARELGKFIRKVVNSPLWQEVVNASREIREFPRKIAQEAGIEKDLEDLRKSTQGTLRDIEKVHLPHIDTFVEIEKDPHPSSEEPSNHKQSNG